MVIESKDDLRLIYPAAVGAGFSSLVIQSAALREALGFLTGGGLLLGLCFAFWLFGLGLGSRIIAAIKAPDPRLLPALLTAVAPVGVASVYLAHFARLLLDIPPGAEPDIYQIIFLTAAVFTAPAIIFGALFPLLASGGGDRAGTVYAAEAIGGFAGGIIYTFAAAGVLPAPFAVAISAVGPTIAGVLIAGGRKTGVIIVGAASIILSVMIVVLPNSINTIDRREATLFKSHIAGLELTARTETKYAAYSLGQAAGQTTLFVNGRASETFPDHFKAEEEAALYGSIPTNLDQVLIIGGSRYELAEKLLAFPIESLTALMHDRRLLDFLAENESTTESAPPDDDRFSIIINDPRRYLSIGPNPELDLVILQMPEPHDLNLNRFYTAEFFAALSAAFPKAVVIAGLDSAPNYLGGELGDYAAGVFKALQKSYPALKAIPGRRMLFVAAKDRERFNLNPQTLLERYRRRKPALDNFDPRMFEFIAEPDRIAEATATLNNSAAPINSDRRPITFYRRALLTLREIGDNDRATPEGTNLPVKLMLAAAKIPPPYWLAISLITLPVLLPRRRGKNRANRIILFAGGVGGFYAFAWQFLILHSYQSCYGSLYGRIGLLIATFFIGLAIGAKAGERISTGRNPLQLFGLWQAVAGAFFPIGAVAALIITPATPGGESLFHLLCAFGGVIAGIDFRLSLAALESTRQARGDAAPTAAAGSIYAADNIGGMLAAIIFATFLIPIAGVLFSAALILLLKISLTPFILKIDSY